MEELQSFLPKGNSPLALWGNGLYGSVMARLLRSMGREVVTVFDRKAKMGMFSEEIPVELPDFDKIREQNFFVIVATIVYEEAICAELSSCGFKEANEYGRISTLADQIARTVLRLATKHWKQN